MRIYIWILRWNQIYQKKKQRKLEAELAEAEKNIEKVISRVPDKKCYAGCYLYNYGDDRQLTSDEMSTQLHLYLDLWKNHKIEGIIVCSNTVADLGFEAVDIYLDFMKKYGKTER